MRFARNSPHSLQAHGDPLSAGCCDPESPSVLPPSSFLPGLVGWINRFFFWLLFTRKKESSDLSHKIFTYECRFKQHVQDWAIPR